MLRDALVREPDDKGVHFAMAMASLESLEPDDALIESHLRRSFSKDDHNFEHRFVLADHLFSQGKSQDAADLFEIIAKRAPATFRQRIARADDLVTARLGRYTGVVVTHKEQFLFVKSGAYPADVFAHQGDSDAEVFESLKVGAGTNFRLRFSRSGPCALDLQLGR